MDEHLVTWLADILGLPVYYQHVDEPDDLAFAWVTRSGDDELDCLDEVGGEPDIVFFDLELYVQSTADLRTKTKLLKAQRDFRGDLAEGHFVDDVRIEDQRDDYEPDCVSENLPPYLAAFQITVSGYEDQTEGP
jgi:hypothetical protein